MGRFALSDEAGMHAPMPQSNLVRKCRVVAYPAEIRDARTAANNRPVSSPSGFRRPAGRGRRDAKLRDIREVKPRRLVVALVRPAFQQGFRGIPVPHLVVGDRGGPIGERAMDVARMQPSSTPSARNAFIRRLATPWDMTDENCLMRAEHAKDLSGNSARTETPSAAAA